MQLHAEIRRPVNLKQMYDQQIAYVSIKQRQTHVILFYVLQSKSKAT